MGEGNGKNPLKSLEEKIVLDKLDTDLGELKKITSDISWQDFETAVLRCFDISPLPRLHLHTRKHTRISSCVLAALTSHLT